LNPIQEAIASSGASLLGLSNKTGIPRTTLRRNIENPDNLTLGEIRRLSNALNLDGRKLTHELWAA
jgi:hypothetical protein